MATTTTVETTRPGTPDLARRCGKCGQVAPCRSIMSRTVNGIPTGTSYRHQCGGCSREFTVISVWNTITHALGAVLLFSVCTFFVVQTFVGPTPLSNKPLTEQPLLYAGLGVLFTLGYAAWIVWKSLVGAKNPLLHAERGAGQVPQNVR